MLPVAFALLLSFGLLELVSRGFISFANPSWIINSHKMHNAVRDAAARILDEREDSIFVFDSLLGWKPRPNADNGVDHINSQGLRSTTKSYPETPALGVRRVAVYGDSFVYGSEVSTEDAWPTLLQQSVPNLEVLNYGVPGYGPDQSLLRFELAGGELNPDIVILGITTPSLTRILTVSPAFKSTTMDFIAKPRFIVDPQSQLQLIPAPISSLEQVREYVQTPGLVREMGAHDFWYVPLVHDPSVLEYSAGAMLISNALTQVWKRYGAPDRPLAGPRGAGVFNERSSGFEVLTLIIRRFGDLAAELGMVPIIAILPDGYSIEGSRKGNQAVMEPVRRYCASIGLQVVDLSDAFLAEPSSTSLDEWFFDKFHYTEAGNALVADWIQSHLLHPTVHH